MNKSKPRGTAAVIVALFAGLIAGTAITGGEEKPAPEPARTAYLDFQSVLKDYRPFRARAAEIMRNYGKLRREKHVEYEGKIVELDKVIREKPADSREGREALSRKIDVLARAKRDSEKIKLDEQLDMHQETVIAFNRVRAKASDVAASLGYTELLNIVGDETRAKVEASLKQIEQQLMLSPVLMFDPKHDITAAVRQAVKDQWDTGITMGEAGITCADDKGAPMAKNKDGEFEIRLGQKVQFAVELLEKGGPPKEENAKLIWDRTGFGTGTMGEDSGEFTATEKPPEGSAFEVIVLSLADPSVSKRAKVRLLDAQGKPLPERKAAVPDSKAETPGKEGEAGGNGN